ncbi:type II toxin-antitoxin system VapC family toxin [Salmonirosea aquatica]|uniref:PIN domain-containing protein n=1 Tax=Salmonirosea aquatica TaxID=2654236 RepID=A0A7C9F561_9BACT|nr:PIN domain-containing protein [Cytophagaceae bacterium SJW1-29]
MRLLLDTHILIWYIMGDETLPMSWREQIQSHRNQKFVSIASLWEIAIKTNIGKLTIIYPLDQLIPAEFELLPIATSHLLAYQQLPLHHRDPFDRILIAQAQTDGFTIMTKDSNFALYDVDLLA